ncbi:MAG: hypothetical protein AAGI14_02185 [Pseudomonadota bacterium]
MTKRKKKSETLDIRLPHEQKQAFMSAVRSNEETASEAIRGFIADYVSKTGVTEHINPVQDLTMTLKQHRLKTLGTVVAASCGLSLIAAMPTAAASPFDRLDKNKDGVLTEGEILEGHDADIIAKLDTDGSGGVSPEELEAAGNRIVIKSSDESVGDNGEKTSLKTLKVLNFTDSTVEIEDNIKSSVIIRRSGDTDLTEEELEAMINNSLTIIEEGDGSRVKVIINGEDITIDDVDETD